MLQNLLEQKLFISKEKDTSHIYSLDYVADPRF